MECESDNKPAFLDCKIHRSELTNKFECSVYKKETFLGLGTTVIITFVVLILNLMTFVLSSLEFKL